MYLPSLCSGQKTSQIKQSAQSPKEIGSTCRKRQAYKTFIYVHKRHIEKYEVIAPVACLRLRTRSTAPQP